MAVAPPHRTLLIIFERLTLVKRQCTDASGDTFFLFDSEAREWGTDLIEEYPGGVL